MGLIPNYSRKVRQSLEAPTNWGVDALVVAGVAGLIMALASLIGHVTAPREEVVQISLSFWALPKYTFYTLSRGIAAYVISLVFTLIYGTISSHNRLAEKFMLPALDVLQSIPVLSFLPVLVLSLVQICPSRWVGLELACVIMIFTAQVWNMTFSYHSSVRSIPIALREAAAMQHLNGWQQFKYLELPASMIGLVWNSMMSMAGGWFIISVEEAFNLAGKDYRLPGIGSYMNEAMAEWNKPAMIAAVVAMICMIVFVDQVLWRPVVVWSERFKLEDVSAADAPDSWVLRIFRRSTLLRLISRIVGERRERRRAKVDASDLLEPGTPTWLSWLLLPILRWVTLVALLAGACWGVYRLGHLLAQLPLYDKADTNGWLAVLWALLLSFARVMGAVLIGAVWAVPAGVLIGLSHKWSNRLQPFVQIAASFPSPMIFPLAVIALAAMHVPFTFGCVVLMLLGTQWYILFNVIAGAMAIPSDLREAGRVYQMSGIQRWYRLYLPAVFPYLVTGLITAAGGAWNATIVAEYLQLPDKLMWAFGLGSLIQDATNKGNYPLLTASVVTMGLFVVLVNRFFWKLIYRMAEQRFSLNV